MMKRRKEKMEIENYNGIEILYKISKEESLNRMGYFFYEFLEKKSKKE